MKSVATFIWKICLVLLVAAWVSMGAVMTVSPRDSQQEFRQWVIGGWGIATAVGLGWPLRSGRPS